MKQSEAVALIDFVAATKALVGHVDRSRLPNLRHSGIYDDLRLCLWKFYNLPIEHRMALYSAAGVEAEE